ncbi:IS605 OrfB family transposase [Longispora fulva]|uniref:IS605 OrfB family transposase n=1 Tax=Longispora fulva TaxID=619741 RepID=A0A8J7GBA5_9ACTN|nr:IS605 OrfB family transposase [Longispora fulva]
MNKLWAKVRDRRTDFAHQVAHRLADTYGQVVIEDLRIINMTASAAGTIDAPGRRVRQKAGLNRAILDKGWHGLELALNNQARKTGMTVIKVNPAYTSQQCSTCKHTDRDNRESQAVFRCVACGHTCNADVNAARNIRDRAHLTAGQAGIGRISHHTPVPRQPPDRA